MPLINSSYLFLRVRVKLARILKAVLWLTALRLGSLRRGILETNYGQSHVVVDPYVRAITEGPFIRTSDSEGFAKLASSMRNCLIACSGLPIAGLDTQNTVGSVFKRLSKSL